MAKKYQQLLPEIQHGFVQKLVADARPSIDPKLNALELEIRSVLNLPTRPAQAGPR
ncbi:hypothetical protein ABXN37_00315 [Piscinibacter sakaiensis]|uniref:hypothetical protein n=1 Tax=Piscinibacter sakaiensis TaxID=1547922 RepID=UPI00372B02A3